MIENYSDFGRIFLQGFAILAVLLLFYRKHILSAFDPLFIYLVTQAFSIELAFIEIGHTKYLLNFLLCQVSFTAGFLLLAGASPKKRTFPNVELLKPSVLVLSRLKVFCILSFIIIVASNVYLIKTTGIALFADDPSAAKTETFIEGGGLGIVRRINWGILYLCALLGLYIYLYKREVFFLLLSVSLLCILILSGSKGTLLYFISLMPLLYQFKDVRILKSFKILDASKYFMLIGGSVLAIFIIISGIKGTVEEAIFTMGSRFLFFGDAMLYYYNTFAVKHFAVNNLSTFLYDELNGPLGFLRLVPYDKPLGFKMVDYQLMIEGSTVFGPNVPYYVKGHIYFGAAGAVIYSFIIGSVVGIVRSWFYKLLEKPAGIIKALLIIHLNIVIYNLPQDSQLFTGVLFDTFILSLPIYLIGIIVMEGNQKKMQGSVA